MLALRPGAAQRLQPAPGEAGPQRLHSEEYGAQGGAAQCAPIHRRRLTPDSTAVRSLTPARWFASAPCAHSGGFVQPSEVVSMGESHLKSYDFMSGALSGLSPPSPAPKQQFPAAQISGGGITY